MSNLAAMLRLPANLKSTHWQILAGPILILLILSMMAASVVDLPLPVGPIIRIFDFSMSISVPYFPASGDVLENTRL